MKKSERLGFKRNLQYHPNNNRNYMLAKKTTTGFRLAIFSKDIKPSSIIHSHSQMIKPHCYKVGLQVNRNCDW